MGVKRAVFKCLKREAAPEQGAEGSEVALQTCVGERVEGCSSENQSSVLGPTEQFTDPCNSTSRTSGGHCMHVVHIAYTQAKHPQNTHTFFCFNF